MSLFQKSVENQYLKGLDKALIDEKYAKFQAYFANPERQENIRNSKEEQFQEGFLRELFVKVFGYTLNPEPNFNLTTELKNIINSKKADGAILKGEDALAVIELKGTDTTDLDKIETQAFGYKNNHPKCVYVITSNFEKLRFYIQNAVDHIDFDLFNLSRDQFSLMWLCLAKENLLNGIPQKIKESSLLKEENITKELYADYSKFRTAIYNNLIKNNPEIDKLLLFNKTQKLLDRFLFVFFAEDRLLLPPNSISEIVKQWTTLKDLDAYVPLYDRFKKYFGYMNTGYKGKKYDIYAYNGGLFIPDEILDNISIDDDILYEHTLKLSSYDFETDVDVNILGHIFEHSLGEIENVQAEIKGEQVDSQKTKRKKDGIFYTPKYITKYIVENTVGKLCEDKRIELDIVDEEYAKGRKNRKKDTIKKLDDKLTDYRNWLLSLTILDPACGSGAFLNQALDFLITEHRKIDDLRAQLFGGSLVFSDITTDILEKNIYGVDLNSESIEIAKLSLWLRTAQKGRKLNKLNNNIKCGNSLIDDPEVAGEKAFNWQKEFPDIYKNGGFDVVIGNPPYVQHRKLFDISSYFKEIYRVYTGTSDLSVYFFEQAFKLLKTDGFLGFINTNKFFNTEYGKPLRELLSSYSLYDIINFEQVAIFQDALVSSVITISSKSSPLKNTTFVEFDKEKVDANIFQIELFNRQRFIDNKYLANSAWIFEDPKVKKVMDKLKLSGTSFKNTSGIKINRGITTGFDEGFLIDDFDYNRLVSKDKSYSKILKPLLKGKNIRRNYIEDSGLWLINSHNGIKGKLERIYLEKDYPLLYQHFIEINDINNGKVENRSDKGEHWTNLRNCAFLEEFEKEKAIWGLISGDWSFAYDNNGYFLTSASYFLTSEKIPIKLITAILNSKLSKFYFENVGEMTAGGAYVLKKVSVEKFIMPNYTLIQSNEIINKEDLAIDLVKNLRQVSISFISHIEAKYKIDKKSNKIIRWYLLSSSDFLNELNKIGIELTLTEESEWLQYFTGQKEKAQNIQSEIDKTDSEIDQMVYKLYGLTDDEIKIVEESV